MEAPEAAICPTCGDTGEITDLPPGGRDQYYGPSVCPTCKGTKKRPPETPPPMQGVMELADCIHCSGKGRRRGQHPVVGIDQRFGGETCQGCKGGGRAKAHSTGPNYSPAA